MLFQFIRERLINFFTIARPAFQLLDERLNVAPISGLEMSATPIAVIAKRHGRLQTAILYALVEIVALLCLLFHRGLGGSMEFIIPLLVSRLQTIIYVTFVYIVNHLVGLGMRIITYLGHTCLGMKLKRPILRIFSLLHIILSNIFGNDYLLLSKDYCKAFPGYVLHQVEKRLYSPCKTTIGKMKKNPIVAFVYRKVLKSIAIPVFGLSVACAFLIIYATVVIHSPPPVCDDDPEQVSTTVGSSVRSADTASTALDRPNDDASGALEFMESEDATVVGGLLDEVKSLLDDAQHSSEATEEEHVLKGAVVDEGLIVQEVAEEQELFDEGESGVEAEQDGEDVKELDLEVDSVDVKEDVNLEVSIEIEEEVEETEEEIDGEEVGYATEEFGEIEEDLYLPEEGSEFPGDEPQEEKEMGKGNGKEEVESEEEEDDNGQVQSQASVVVEAEESESELVGANMESEELEVTKGEEQEASVCEESGALKCEGLADGVVNPGEAPVQMDTQVVEAEIGVACADAQSEVKPSSYKHISLEINGFERLSFAAGRPSTPSLAWKPYLPPPSPLEGF
ncbi:hypothetical protein CPC08DRAFT_526521 [Agrocybe pediades]|nr:hypothetical protein CPC08DRAFT_526521 [Agrocybe pediades]